MEWRKLTFNLKVTLLKPRYPNLSIDNFKSQIELTNLIVNDAEAFFLAKTKDTFN